MISSIMGKYLMDKGLISQEQFADLLVQQHKTRVKLGMIAVSEGYMSKEEAEKVNQLQEIIDKRFGDIAVEKGYLTKGQVDALLQKQCDAYLAFAQALESQQLLTVELLEAYMVDYRFDNDLADDDIEVLKSDDVDRILPLFLPDGSTRYIDAARTALRLLMRCVDSEVFPGKAYITEEIDADYGVFQKVKGDHGITGGITYGIAGRLEELIGAAASFRQEGLVEANGEMLDRIGELINCISSLYVSSASKEGISLEIFPPESGKDIKKVRSKEMMVMPLYIKGSCINLLLTADDKIEMN